MASALSAFDIPDIWCPFRHRIHPETAGVDDRLFAWAQRADLIRGESAAQHFRQAGYGTFSALAYPGAVRLDLVAAWMGHTWIADDLLDEGHTAVSYADRVRVCRELLAQLPLDLRGPRPSGPLSDALADLWRQTAEPMSPAWRKRFAAHYRDWLSGSLLRHGRSHAQQTNRSLTTYVRCRRINSGCVFSFDLIEPGNLSELPEWVAECDTYTSVRDAAANVIAWTNDIFSVHKETARDDFDNLVVLLRDTGNRGWDSALREAARMIEETTRDYLTARADLLRLHALTEAGDDEWRTVENTLTALDDWIAGSLHWHAGSPRYTVVESTSEGRAPSYVESHLVDGVPQSCDIAVAHGGRDRVGQ